MNFGLTDEQQMIVDTTRAFVENELYPHEAQVERTGHLEMDLVREIQQKAIETGLYAANIPEEFGGGGLDTLTWLLYEKELGRANYALHWTCVARPSNILCAGTPEQQEKYLQRCIAGETWDSLAMTEPGAGSDLRGMKATAKQDGDDWILNGTKHFISGPVMPHFAIVFAATGVDETRRGPRKRITAFLVDVGTPGFEIAEGTRCVSYRGYKTFKLDFTDVRLGPGQVLGEEGCGLELSGKWLGMGRIWVGATCCGKAERLLAAASDWCATRRQFGQPIGQFQATGFKLADMATELRAGDLLVRDAVERAERGTMTDADAAMVKLYCSEMLNRVADHTVQIHGGMGLMEELDVQRLWRDSRLERIWDGTSEVQRHIITRSILRPLGA